jgi:glycosyltransferase involved in cell wall biosynthesis
MKVLISGNYRHSFDLPFIRFGHQVILFNDEVLYWQKERIIKNRYTHKLFWKQFSVFVQNEFIKLALESRPDLILVLKGWFFSPKTIVALRRQLPNTIFFCFNPDNPFNTWHSGSNNAWITNSIPFYDAYFIWGKFLLERIKQKGVACVEYLPFAFDPEQDYPVQPDAEERKRLGNDVVFYGSWDKEREFWLRELLDFDLGIWGDNYWISRCKDRRLKKCYRGNAGQGEFLSKILASSKISINILRLQNKTSHNMRTFETPARRGFMLSESSQEARDFFKEGEEAAYFSSPAQLREKTRYYLDHDQERQAIAEAGYRRCLYGDYSYSQRVKRILDVYSELSTRSNYLKKFKVAFIITHPIPCRLPIYKKLSLINGLDVKINFLSDFGINEVYNPDFCHTFKWDFLDLNGVRYEILNPDSKINIFLKMFLVIRKIISEISNNIYDVVIIPGYGFSFYWIAFLGCLLNKTPMLLLGEPRFPESNSPFLRMLIKRRILKFLFPKIVAFGYIGTQAKKFYKSYGVSDSKLFFMPYAANNEFFMDQAQKLAPCRDEIKGRLGVSRDRPVILFLSKVNSNKGPFELLEAFEKLERPATLVYVGSGPLMSKLASYVEQKKIKNVKLFGFQNISQVSDFYAIADIFVLFSYSESWGLVLNEAMCFSLPVITTNAVMASYDLVRDGENGYILSPGDIKGLTSSLNRLLGDADLRRSMGKRSLEMISPWNYDKFIAGLLESFSIIKKK